MSRGTILSKKVVQVVTEKFVKSLKYRYSDHVSDDFLIALLTMRFGVRKAMFNRITAQQAAYDVGSEIFESILEYGCHAGGNGHHVAQAYSEMFKEYDEQPKSAA